MKRFQASLVLRSASSLKYPCWEQGGGDDDKAGDTAAVRFTTEQDGDSDMGLQELSVNSGQQCHQQQDTTTTTTTATTKTNIILCPFTSKPKERLALTSALSPLLSPHTRSGELQTQKLKTHLLRPQSFNVLHLKPKVGQCIAIHATLSAKDFFLAYYYLSGPFTCIFSKTSPDFFLRRLWLTLVPV